MATGDNEGPGSEADNLTSSEAAELVAAEAEARAQAARARADELRRKLDESRSQGSSHDRVDHVDHVEDDLDDAESRTAVAATTEVPEHRRRLPLPRFATVVRAAGTLLIAGSLAVTGLMLWQHRKSAEQRHLEAEYVAAARQGVVNLMSIDSNTAEETVQRLIDGSTGKFQANFKDGSDDLVKAMQEAKVVTKVTVNDVAVDEIDGDTAILLVAATSERQDAQAPKEDKQPRVWRVVLTVVRDGGQIKLSDVEFA